MHAVAHYPILNSVPDVLLTKRIIPLRSIKDTLTIGFHSIKNAYVCETFHTVCGRSHLVGLWPVQHLLA